MALVARPTIYSGIQMRSRLEATFAANLDRFGAGTRAGWSTAFFGRCLACGAAAVRWYVREGLVHGPACCDGGDGFELAYLLRRDA